MFMAGLITRASRIQWRGQFHYGNGIAVIYPNVRGSSGYGKSFLRLDDG
jgi:dipeptidyl aminopeptidase/acylaminoacyl peptidase